MREENEIALSEFERSLSRPTMLSDPCQEYGEDCLGKILAKSDQQLSGVDYSILFNTNLPCGKNTETMYFLPASIDYLSGLPAEHAEMLEEWLGFIVKNIPDIESLNLMNSFISLLAIMFESVTSSYDVVSMGDEECGEKGWGISHFEYVRGSLIVCGLVQELSRTRQGKMIAKGFIEHLLGRNDEAANQWLIEIASECEEEIDIFLSTEQFDKLLLD
ncbi:hypothetical protein K6Y31_13415 [Motilimonas cestriensis]|uniref:Uncharacterized protein n=1 Tax=Motilimonas cestriensis TaxID=2742685 RepID=A0ABS8WEM7_9GAMM|nr:hypothetical protein [Motilimonas cestriensis]MCE2595805.1 hypothetical protein [Motilimonas cestriensis]